MSSRSRRRWQVLAQPKVVVPLLLTAALLASAIGLSDIPQAFSRIRDIPPESLLGALLLAALYLVLKGWQFYGFLRELHISINWRHVLLAYAVGELTLTLPLGVYVQNYVLQRLQGTGFYRSAAVTTIMLIIESGVFFLVLAVIGVRGWPWLQPLALACLLASIAVFAVLAHSDSVWSFVARQTNRFQILGQAPLELLGGLRSLTFMRVIMRRGCWTLFYAGALMWAFLVVSHGVGVERLTFAQAITIYAFSLSIALICGGVLSQVGIVEMAGMGVAQAWGYSFTEGLAMLLGFRLVWTACIWLLNLPIIFLLRREFADSGGNSR